MTRWTERSESEDARAIGTGATPAPIDPAWAWAPYAPQADRPWTLKWAAHLYRRAGFGANWQQLEQALAEGPQRTVDRLVRPYEDAPAAAANAGDSETGGSGSIDALRAWWLRRMIETPFPLLEKMTLFWHDHLGISLARVKDPPLMAKHVAALRKHALGRYRDLLNAMSNDPAVYLGLNADANRKALPNENVVRQLMDQLSLGPGHYGEEDIREAARAFTGWFVLRGTLRFFDREHDSGEKTILGSKGPWNASDVLRIVLDQPAAPRNLVRRLYRWFVSEVDEPADALLDPLVKTLAADYHVGNVVETVLRSNLFFSPAAYRRRVKTPVDYALGIIKGIGGIVPTILLGQDLAEQGQDLYQPPTVRRLARRRPLAQRGDARATGQSGAGPVGKSGTVWRQAGPQPAGRTRRPLLRGIGRSVVRRLVCAERPRRRDASSPAAIRAVEKREGNGRLAARVCRSRRGLAGVSIELGS